MRICLWANMCVQVDSFMSALCKTHFGCVCCTFHDLRLAMNSEMPKLMPFYKHARIKEG